MGMGVEGGAKVGRRIGIHHSFIYPVIIYWTLTVCQAWS
jgi:hypothetical protein